MYWEIIDSQLKLKDLSALISVVIEKLFFASPAHSDPPLFR